MKKIALRDNKGSALQIVLIVFLLLITVITSYSMFIQSSLSLYKDTVYLNEQRKIEITFMAYVKQQISEDILISDSFSRDESELDYRINDMGNYYEISVDISTKNYQYGIDFNIELETLQIYSYQYRKNI